MTIISETLVAGKVPISGQYHYINCNCALLYFSATVIEYTATRLSGLHRHEMTSAVNVELHKQSTNNRLLFPQNNLPGSSPHTNMKELKQGLSRPGSNIDQHILVLCTGNRLINGTACGICTPSGEVENYQQGGHRLQKNTFCISYLISFLLDLVNKMLYDMTISHVILISSRKTMKSIR